METFDECDRKITIETLPDYFVIYERWIGNYADLEQDWKFFVNKYQDYVIVSAMRFFREQSGHCFDCFIKRN